MQAGLQGFHLLRGIFSSLTLFFLAGPIANFLGIPEVGWAYQMLALLPTIYGLIHFDIYRLQRQMNYLPSILSTSIPAFLSVLLIWPLFSLFGDYRVMLFSVLAQGVLGVATSHLMAERTYRLTFDPAIMRLAFGFGWPLLLNNILLFAVFQGDKLIVGRELGLVTLAIFAMGFTLTLTPTLVAAKSTQSFFLPQLSASKTDPARFFSLSMTTLQISLVSGLLVVIAAVTVGKPLILFLLGEKYADLIPYLTWLAILQALRVFKGGSSVTALAQGQTSNAMIANLFRAVSLGFAWYVAANGGDILAIIWIAIAGEAIGYPVSLLLVRYRLKLSLKPMVAPILLSVATLGMAALHTTQSDVAGSLRIWSLVGMTLLFLLSLATMHDLRRYILKRVISRYSE